MPTDSEISEAFTLLAKVVDKYGWKHTLTRLKQMSIDNSDVLYLQSLAEKITSQCASYYSVPVDDLFDSSNRGTTVVCRNMCMVLLKEFIDATMEDIGSYFNRSKTIAFKAIKSFDEIKESPFTPEDEEFVNSYKILKTQTQKYLESIKSIVKDGGTKPE